MSLDLLILFAAAMVAAVVGRCLAEAALLAYLTCVALLTLVGVFVRRRGLRGPVL